MGLRTAGEAMALHAALEARPFEVPVTSTSRRRSNMSALNTCPTSNSVDVIGLDFAQRRGLKAARLDDALLGLFRRLSIPNPSWTAS